MADAKTLSLEILLHIAQSLSLPLHSLTAVIGLLNEGGTVPFIARYRKEATGNLDEVQRKAAMRFWRGTRCSGQTERDYWHLE